MENEATGETVAKVAKRYIHERLGSVTLCGLGFRGGARVIVGLRATRHLGDVSCPSCRERRAELAAPRPTATFAGATVEGFDVVAHGNDERIVRAFVLRPWGLETVREVARFQTPDAEPAMIAEAERYAAELQARHFAPAGPKLYEAFNSRGERVRVTIPED